MDSTLTTLLADVRRDGSIPSHSGTGSLDSDLIAHLNKNLVTIAAEVIKCREGFYRVTKDYTISTTTLRYRIPSRAIGNRLAAILILDANGNTLRKLDEIPYSRFREFNSLTDCAGYVLEAGDAVLVPTRPTTAGVTLRMVYYLRPGNLTSSLDTASGKTFTVTAVSGNVITLMASHGITTLTKIDIIKKEPPCETLTVDELPSATASTTVTVADGSRVEVGDFVCLADYAPKPQMPDAFYPALSLMGALKFHQALGNSEDVSRLENLIYGSMTRQGRKGGVIESAVSLIAPRVEENARKIVSHYGVLGSLDGPSRRIF